MLLIELADAGNSGEDVETLVDDLKLDLGDAKQ